MVVSNQLLATDINCVCTLTSEHKHSAQELNSGEYHGLEACLKYVGSRMYHGLVPLQVNQRPTENALEVSPLCKLQVKGSQTSVTQEPPLWICLWNPRLSPPFSLVSTMQIIYYQSAYGMLCMPHEGFCSFIYLKQYSEIFIGYTLISYLSKTFVLTVGDQVSVDDSIGPQLRSP